MMFGQPEEVRPKQRRGPMGDYIISKERLSWLGSLREFHQLERDDDREDIAVEALEMEYAKYCLIGEELQKKLKDAQNAQVPVRQSHEELLYKVERAKTSMEKEEANRKETEKQLFQEMQLKDSLIMMDRENMEQRFRNEIEKKEKKWEHERLRMRVERETNSKKLIIAEAEIEEMMQFEHELQDMKKEHKGQMSQLKVDLKVDEEKWKVEIDQLQRQQTQWRADIRTKEKLWVEDSRAREKEFGREMAMKEMAWKTERHKLLKKNRTLALKSCFTEHWIKDLEEQIHIIGAEILAKKRIFAEHVQALEEKCVTLMDDQGLDSEPLRQLCRTKLKLYDMMPSANKNKNSIWKIVDGWK